MRDCAIISVDNARQMIDLTRSSTCQARILERCRYVFVSSTSMSQVQSSSQPSRNLISALHPSRSPVALDSETGTDGSSHACPHVCTSCFVPTLYPHHPNLVVDYLEGATSGPAGGRDTSLGALAYERLPRICDCNHALSGAATDMHGFGLQPSFSRHS